MKANNNSFEPSYYLRNNVSYLYSIDRVLLNTLIHKIWTSYKIPRKVGDPRTCITNFGFFFTRNTCIPCIDELFSVEKYKFRLLRTTFKKKHQCYRRLDMFNMFLFHLLIFLIIGGKSVQNKIFDEKKLFWKHKLISNF